MLLKRLKDLREDNDLLQRDVAEALNIPERTYGNYELGVRSTPYEILIQLAILYKTSTDYLLGVTDEKRHYPRSKSYQ